MTEIIGMRWDVCPFCGKQIATAAASGYQMPKHDCKKESPYYLTLRERLEEEIRFLLQKFNQLTRDGLRRELKEKGLQFTDEEMADAIKSLFLADKLLLGKW